MILLVAVLCAIAVAQNPCPFNPGTATQNEIYAQVQLVKQANDADAMACMQFVLGQLSTACDAGVQTACNSWNGLTTALTVSSGWQAIHGQNLFAGRSGPRADLDTPADLTLDLAGLWGSTTNANQRMVHFQQCNKITITGGNTQTPLHNFVMDGVTESHDQTGISHPIHPSVDYIAKSTIAAPTPAEQAMGATAVMVIYGEFPEGGPVIEQAIRFINANGQLVLQQNMTVNGNQMAPIIIADQISAPNDPTTGCAHAGCPSDWVDTEDSWSPACCNVVPMQVFNMISYPHDNMYPTCLYASSAGDVVVADQDAGAFNMAESEGTPANSSKDHWEWNSLSYLLLAIILTLPVGMAIGYAYYPLSHEKQEMSEIQFPDHPALVNTSSMLVVKETEAARDQQQV